MLTTSLWVIAGVLLGVVFLRFARAGGAARERRVLAAGLLIAALIYVVFALLGGATARWVVIELSGVVLFGGLALLGQRIPPAAIAAGWAAHMFWDTLLHLTGAGAEFTPHWYPLLCIGFDVLVAGAVAQSVWRTPRVEFGRSTVG